MKILIIPILSMIFWVLILVFFGWKITLLVVLALAIVVSLLSLIEFLILKNNKKDGKKEL